MNKEPRRDFVKEAEDEQRFLEMYRIGRAKELVEHIRWKQKPPDGVVFDKDNRAVIPDELPDQSYWRMYFAGTAPKLDEDDDLALASVEKKLSGKKMITPIDIYNLEQAYCKLNPFWEPDSATEERVKKFMRKTAEEEVTAGRFETLDIALRHYGMSREAEELRDA